MTELGSTSTGTGTKFSTGTTCTRILVHVLVPHRLNTQVDLLNFVSLDLQLYCGTRVARISNKFSTCTTVLNLVQLSCSVELLATL